jgi:hypothetical protein
MMKAKARKSTDFDLGPAWPPEAERVYACRLGDRYRPGTGGRPGRRAGSDQDGAGRRAID